MLIPRSKEGFIRSQYSKRSLRWFRIDWIPNWWKLFIARVIPFTTCCSAANTVIITVMPILKTILASILTYIRKIGHICRVPVNQSSVWKLVCLRRREVKLWIPRARVQKESKSVSGGRSNIGLCQRMFEKPSIEPRKKRIKRTSITNYRCSMRKFKSLLKSFTGKCPSIKNAILKLKRKRLNNSWLSWWNRKWVKCTCKGESEDRRVAQPRETHLKAMSVPKNFCFKKIRVILVRDRVQDLHSR